MLLKKSNYVYELTIELFTEIKMNFNQILPTKKRSQSQIT